MSEKLGAFHYYDLIKRTVIGLGIPILRNPDIVWFRVVYVSRRGVVIAYQVYRRGNYIDCAEVLDIDRMRITQLYLPQIGQEMGFSPDLSKYWLVKPGRVDFPFSDASKLYVYKTPKETLSALRAGGRVGR